MSHAVGIEEGDGAVELSDVAANDGRSGAEFFLRRGSTPTARKNIDHGVGH